MVGLRLIFHLVSAAAYGYTAWYDAKIVPAEFWPIKGVFLSKFVWLTVIDLYLQLFYHLWALVATFYPSRSFHYFAKVIIGPIGMSVVSLFWTLYFLDPDFLLHDENARRVISIAWFNHGLHTLPTVTILIDLLLWNHGRVAKSAAFKGLLSFATLYIIDIHYVHYTTGFWAYPILGQLSLPLRAAFIIGCASVFFVKFVFLDAMSATAHAHDAVEQKKKAKKH